MNVAVCLITRLSNKYLREWTEYYKGIGFDKIFIYDNNRDDEEKCIDEIPDYVDNGFVDIIDFGNENGRVQESAYQDCYEKHNKEYDWIAFFDDDEYVTLNNCNNIKDFLSNPIFENVNGVAFPMINYCDTDVIINDKKTRLDVYTSVKDLNFLFSNSYYKTIAKCGINVSYKRNIISDGSLYDGCCHIPLVDNIPFNNISDCDGNKIDGIYGTSCQFYVYNAFLKHIPTGCIDDYINGKRRRGWPDTDSPMQYEKENQFGYDYFLLYNNDSEEKRKYYEENKFRHFCK